ncbi:unnamed protein product [Eruca vesicaria subsp. sativa]|uniref:Uncharacterized protein n=1 Tax=Eruca vesicaria subsp. sativa TaxID=29727 RepID=A0ABC8K813_ERUVS|nr:unnamed protein product [Eruca vesicaria subsp. sativa]
MLLSSSSKSKPPAFQSVHGSRTGTDIIMYLEKIMPWEEEDEYNIREAAVIRIFGVTREEEEEEDGVSKYQKA